MVDLDVNIKFKNGENFLGFWDPRGYYIKGVLDYLEKRNVFKSSKLEIDSYQSKIYIEKNIDIGNLYYFMGVKSLKCINKKRKNTN